MKFLVETNNEKNGLVCAYACQNCDCYYTTYCGSNCGRVCYYVEQ